LPSTSSSPTPPDPAGPTRRGKWVLATLAVALVLIVGGITAAVVLSSGDSGSGGTPAPKALSAKVGQPAPDFELATLDGKTVKLSDYKGTPVVLNFWASWCNPCRREFPMFRDELATADGKWALVGVNTQDFVKSDGQKFAKDEKATWPNGFDADGAVKAAYSGSPGLPQTFFVDADGIIRAHLFGELSSAELQKQLAKIGV